MMCAVGFGITVFARWAGGWEPVLLEEPLVLISWLVAAPLGFLAGIGCFDYWVYYALGKPDAAGGPLRARRDAAGRTTSASTPTTR